MPSAFQFSQLVRTHMWVSKVNSLIQMVKIKVQRRKRGSCKFNCTSVLLWNFLHSTLKASLYAIRLCHKHALSLLFTHTKRWDKTTSTLSPRTVVLAFLKGNLPFKNHTTIWDQPLLFYALTTSHHANWLSTVNCVTEPRRAHKHRQTLRYRSPQTQTYTKARLSQSVTLNSSQCTAAWLTSSIVWCVFITVGCEEKQTIWLY